ncbi:MAG: hypothetical protein AAGF87_08160 [Bacteroidota bacterium]
MDAQLYTETKTKHRFAQMNVGLEWESGMGGRSSFLSSTGELSSLSNPTTNRPRIIIGGLHFWGHADFAIAFPLTNPLSKSGTFTTLNASGVETWFNYYPWAVKDKGLRPYIGFSILPFSYRQQDGPERADGGPSILATRIPLKAGVTATFGSHLFTLGLTWNYANGIDYPLSESVNGRVSLQKLLLNFSYRHFFDTTISAEDSWESGQTESVTEQLGDQGKLNGFYLGAGMSSAWWLGQSAYNESFRPFLPAYNTSIMPDLTIGHYWHKSDMQVGLSYRSYRGAHRAFGVFQQSQRRSIGLEWTKNLFDYKGFVPFIGPVVSWEDLSFIETEEGGPGNFAADSKLAYGLTFGWDIRPNSLQSWYLRTNLRYFPNLRLDTDQGPTIKFDNIEFNFIQLIIFPGRIF